MLRLLLLIGMAPMLGCAGVFASEPVADPFTRIVEIAPTPERAAGIRFSCAAGHEHKYAVMDMWVPYLYGSATMDNPSIIRQAIAESWTPDSSLPLALGDGLTRSNWRPNAKLRIQRVRGSQGVEVAAIERRLRATAAQLEACYEWQTEVWRDQQIRATLVFDEGPQLRSFTVYEGSLGAAGWACFEATLGAVDWLGLSLDTTGTLAPFVAVDWRLTI